MNDIRRKVATPRRRAASRWRWFRLDELESRWLLANFLVTSTGDGADADPADMLCDDGTGACTLRAAIEQANANAGSDTIEFRIPGAGPHTIQPAAPLPFITDPVVLDGSTQPGFAGRPVIELDGSAAGTGPAGLQITAGNSTVRGLVIHRFAVDGLVLSQKGGNVISGNLQSGVTIANIGTNRNVIAGNFIGTDLAGATVLANGGDGVILFDQAANNTVGGVTPAARNVLSGNQNGVRLTGSGVTGNVVEGNFIGTDLTGTVRIGNAITGVGIDSGATGNVVGGIAVGNLISGNRGGVRITSAGSSFNSVFGNLIGTEVTGTAALGNDEYGVLIDFDASTNYIGGGSTAGSNIISGNNGPGIRLATGARYNAVLRNFIGMDLTGSAALANVGSGVLIDSGAFSNQIGSIIFTVGGPMPGGSVISGNDLNGVEINGSTSSGNLLSGNLIGTNAAGTTSVGNALDGVRIIDSPNNEIGNAFGPAGRNIISGNGQNGVAIIGGAATRNIVQNSFIGTDAAGAAALPNSFDGVRIVDARGNVIGGNSAAARNIISGNGSPAGGSGVAIFGRAATGNQVLGNFIGTDSSGTRPLGNIFQGVALNSPRNFVGGVFIGQGNVISGNGQHGVALFGPDAEQNAVLSNFIGTDPTGTQDIGNFNSGIFIERGSNNGMGGFAFRGQLRTAAVPRRAREPVQLLGGNVIAFNGHGPADAGIFIAGGTGNTIFASNSIFSNVGLGIDLAPADANPNDPGDGDFGANRLLNFPVLASATRRGGRITVRGRLNSTPNTMFVVQIFANQEQDPTGHGEGRTFLGFIVVTTNEFGDAPFSRRLRSRSSADPFVTSNTTDFAGNTSEFSAGITVVNREQKRPPFQNWAKR